MDPVLLLRLFPASKFLWVGPSIMFFHFSWSITASWPLLFLDHISCSAPQLPVTIHLFLGLPVGLLRSSIKLITCSGNLSLLILLTCPSQHDLLFPALHSRFSILNVSLISSVFTLSLLIYPIMLLLLHFCCLHSTLYITIQLHFAPHSAVLLLFLSYTITLLLFSQSSISFLLIFSFQRFKLCWISS